MNKTSVPEVKSDKLFLNLTDCKIDQDGLLSEVIFGTTRDYKCTCGKYSFKHIYGNKTCPDCNVTCESSDVRYDNFGKIVLPLNIIKTLKKKEFKKITGKYFRNFLNPNQHDLISSINIYLLYDISQDKITI
jgi:DNA-directed RNA polymerase beta' subunit